MNLILDIKSAVKSNLYNCEADTCCFADKLNDNLQLMGSADEDIVGVMFCVILKKLTKQGELS